MAVELRPYQERAIAALRRSYQTGHRAPCLVLPTGGGKTIVAASVIDGALKLGNRCLFVAHRRELIQQTVDKLARAGIWDVRVIRGADDTGRPDAPVIVGSIQTLTMPRWLGKLPPAELVIPDECFPAGTLIDGQPIETLRIGDLVKSYNETTDTVELRRIRRLFRSRPSTLVTVHLDDGRAITCTSGHPFFDGVGYTAAAQLTKGQHVFGQPQKDATQLRRMRHLVSGMEADSGGDLLVGLQRDATSSPQEVSCFAVHSVRSRSAAERSKRTGGSSPRSSVLFGLLPIVDAIEGAFGADGSHEPQARKQADDRAQPDARRGNTGQGQRIAAGDEPSAASTWRERNRTIPDGREANRGTADWLDVRPSSANPSADGIWVSGSLQDRHRLSGHEDRRRGGRLEPLRPVSSGAGREEAGIARVARVDRVEVHERRGGNGFGALCTDDLVYNIEVEGNHNYFVDGVLVHNCHHLAAVRWRQIADAYPAARLLGLTATPERGDGKPLGDIFDDLIVGATVSELTDAGYLVPCRVFAPVDSLESKHLALDPVSAYQQHGDGERAIVFCVTVDHATQVTEAFTSAGIPAGTVVGTSPPDQRALTLQRFAAGELRVCVNVNVLTEGFDDPPVSVCILARKPQHAGMFLQMAGRVLRPAPGKRQATLIDLCGSVHDHGPPDLERTYSLTGKAITGVVRDRIRQCPTCGAVFLAGPQRCPQCGAGMPQRELEPPRSTGQGVVDISTLPKPPARTWTVSITAKFPGVCRRCTGRIRPGDQIYWAKGEKPRHVECAA